MEQSNIIKLVESKWNELSKFPKLDSIMRDKLWDKFRLEFNYNSNHMEGNTLTYGETQLLLFFDQTGGEKEFRYYEEMKAHNVAFEVVRESAYDSNHQLTEKFIRELNEIILVEPYYKNAITPDGDETKKLITPGSYKSTPNSVRLQSGQIHHYPEPNEVLPLMSDLIDWFRNKISQEKINVVEIAAILHYKLVAIHPFDDGNGRVARLLMNYVLLKFSYPPVIIRSEDKPKYLTTLYKADVGDAEALIQFVAENLIWSLDISIKAHKGLDINEDSDWEKELKIIKEKNAQKAIEKYFNQNTLVDFYKNNLKRLLLYLEVKLASINEHFIENTINFYINNDRSLIFATEELLKTRVLEKMILVQIEFGPEFIDVEGDVTAINILFRWDKYKFAGSNNVFSIEIPISFVFNEYNYRVITEINNPVLIEKMYGKDLGEADFESIGNYIGKTALQEIKNRL